MNLTKADNLPFDPRSQMSDIFVDGFGQHLTIFSKDKNRLATAFSHIFDLSHFYVAHDDTTISAMTACTSHFSPLKFDKLTCQKELGFLRGRLAYFGLTKYLVNHKFPFEFAPNMGRIEIVATAAAFRGQGIAFALINHIIATTPFEEYVLEVASDNTSAIRLYEKLGFVVFTKVDVPWYMKKYIVGYLYMRYTK
ncbi:MAG: GNAT family N-acetyltransferase [Firmicutes bacterium]|nr:GNAT family N-acetyltransferase [Bacillota bacterium]